VHGFPSPQYRAGPPPHTPADHASVSVQNCPSLHTVPSATSAYVHVSAPSSQASDVHGVPSAQFLAPPPPPAPAAPEPRERPVRRKKEPPVEVQEEPREKGSNAVSILALAIVVAGGLVALAIVTRPGRKGKGPDGGAKKGQK